MLLNWLYCSDIDYLALLLRSEPELENAYSGLAIAVWLLFLPLWAALLALFGTGDWLLYPFGFLDFLTFVFGSKSISFSSGNLYDDGIPSSFYLFSICFSCGFFFGLA